MPYQESKLLLLENFFIFLFVCLSAFRMWNLIWHRVFILWEAKLNHVYLILRSLSTHNALYILFLTPLIKSKTLSNFMCYSKRAAVTNTESVNLRRGWCCCLGGDETNLGAEFKWAFLKSGPAGAAWRERLTAAVGAWDWPLYQAGRKRKHNACGKQHARF